MMFANIIVFLNDRLVAFFSFKAVSVCAVECGCTEPAECCCSCWLKPVACTFTLACPSRYLLSASTMAPVCFPFGRLYTCIPSSPPQYRWLHSHRVFLLLRIPGPGEARGASELAVHVLDVRGYLRRCHGLGHHPALW